MNNETQWTPGPWEVTDRTNGHASLIRSKTALEYSHLAGMDIGKAVVSLCGKPHECEANARLIAAAPEMAALLGRNQNIVMNVLTSGHGVTPAIAAEMREMLDETRALLAKIEGATSCNS